MLLPWSMFQDLMSPRPQLLFREYLCIAYLSTSVRSNCILGPVFAEAPVTCWSSDVLNCAVIALPWPATPAFSRFAVVARVLFNSQVSTPDPITIPVHRRALPSRETERRHLETSYTWRTINHVGLLPFNQLLAPLMLMDSYFQNYVDEFTI